MKGGLALMLAALKAVEASPLADRIGYEVVINSATRRPARFSSAALIARSGARQGGGADLRARALPDGTLAGARPGSGNFSIVVRGRQRACRPQPEEGRNAIVAAADLALRLAAAKRPGSRSIRRRSTAAGPNNVVPDLAVLRVNIRPRRADDPAARSR